jgi:hypothetical protein
MPQEQYLGNPNLKKANTAFEFTATQMELDLYQEKLSEYSFLQNIQDHSCT